MNLLKAQDTELKLKALDHTLEIIIDDMPNMKSKQVVIFLPVIRKDLLEKILNIIEGYACYLQPSPLSDSPDHTNFIEFVIY